MKFLSTAISKIKAGFENLVEKINPKSHKKRRRSYSNVAHSLRKNVVVAGSRSTGKVVRNTSKGRNSDSFVFFNNVKINKKRFVIITGVIVIAVALPVIVTAANSPMQKLPETQEIVAPEAQFVKSMEGTDSAEPIKATEISGELSTATTTQSDTAQEESMSVEAVAQNVVEATPTPVVYTELSMGMQDERVKEIQTRLMELNYMDNDEPTDLFGPITAQAIGYFQRKHGIDMDGVAGEQTQVLLFSDQAKPYSVTVGGEGTDVESIQQRLQELGYDVSVTAYFGTETENAVKYFQRMNGLYDDGSVGAETKEVLYSKGAEVALEKPKSTKKPSSSGGSSGGGGGSSSGGGGGGSTSHVANPGTVAGFLEAAQALNGIPYVRGGKSSAGVDCSGFVYVAMQNAGIGIGYMTSGGWAGSGYPTVGSMDELQAGDIVCFNGHVGIYLGGGSMIDASSSEGRVRICSNIQGSSYWTRNFICGKRPL